MPTQYTLFPPPSLPPPPQALEALEDAIKSCAVRSQLAQLTSRFYTIIPHDFGRRVPAVISDLETLQKKFEMLLVLGDIEIAQGLQKDKEKKEKEVREGGGREGGREGGEGGRKERKVVGIRRDKSLNMLASPRPLVMRRRFPTPWTSTTSY